MKINLISEHNDTQVNFRVHQLKPESARYWTENGKITENGNTIRYEPHDYYENVYVGSIKVGEDHSILDEIYRKIDGTLAVHGPEMLPSLGIAIKEGRARSFMVGDVIKFMVDGFGWHQVRVANVGFKVI